MRIRVYGVIGIDPIEQIKKVLLVEKKIDLAKCKSLVIFENRIKSYGLEREPALPFRSDPTESGFVRGGQLQTRVFNSEI